MYTIFFTINCVEQLTFSKTFVNQLQFKQLIFFCLKVKLLEIHVRQMIFDFRAVDQKSDICSNCVEQMKNCVEQIFWANKFRADDHDVALGLSEWPPTVQIWCIMIEFFFFQNLNWHSRILYHHCFAVIEIKMYLPLTRQMYLPLTRPEIK